MLGSGLERNINEVKRILGRCRVNDHNQSQHRKTKSCRRERARDLGGLFKKKTSVLLLLDPASEGWELGMDISDALNWAVVSFLDAAHYFA